MDTNVFITAEKQLSERSVLVLERPGATERLSELRDKTTLAEIGLHMLRRGSEAV